MNDYYSTPKRSRMFRTDGAIVNEADALNEDGSMNAVMMIDDNGSLRPARVSDFSGGGGGGVVTVADITDASTVGKAVMLAADAAAARSAIGAGTGNSSLAVATTAPVALAAAAAVGTGTTAARADHVHPLPTATQVGAAPTSHTHTTANVTGLDAALGSKLTASKGAAQTDSVATDIEGLVADFNSLLANLRTAGIIST